MPESFDAFYARTVGNVTSQMHALAGGDGAADHAIREAYARAYQQWYEVAGFRDSEAWVLNVAEEAYQRRRPEAPVAMPEAPAGGHDSLSWPGLYRPVAARHPTTDPEATLAPRVGQGGGPVPGDPVAGDPVAGRPLPSQPVPDGPAPGGPPTATALPGQAFRGQGEWADGDSAQGEWAQGGDSAQADSAQADSAQADWAQGAWAYRDLAHGDWQPGGTAQAEIPPGGLFGSPGSPASGGPAASASAYGGAAPAGAPATWAADAGATRGGPAAAGALPDWAGHADDAPAGAPANWAAGAGAIPGGPTAAGALPDWAGHASATPGAATPMARISGHADAFTPAGVPPTAPSARLAERFRRPSLGARPDLLGSRRNLIAAAVAVAVIVVAGIAVTLGVGGSGHGSGRGASPGVSASAVAKPTVHMLPAGRTGSRAAIPWSLIGPGWTLAEVSTAQPDANGAPAGSGRYTSYLVDPEGGRYRIRTTSGTRALDLLAWSGNSRVALYSVGSPQAGSPAYGLLALGTGTLTSLRLPAGVAAVGFTRPDGFNILAVRQGQDKYRLERYNLAGAYQATLSTLPRPAGQQGAAEGNALSSPDGDTAVWGISGDEMQLVSNAGGLIRRLHVPGSGTPPSCTPISWWSSHTILAYCNVAGSPGAGRLWLVPTGGGASTGLTGISGSASGSGDLTGAWQSGGKVYVTSTTAAVCKTAASGPGGQQILRLQGGAETPVSVPDSMNNHSTIVAGVGGRLLVLAQTSCPGTSSLIWFNPSTSAVQTVLTAPATEVGVVAAVPYGSGPAASTDGLS